MECLKSDTTMTVMPLFERQFCVCTDRNSCHFCSPFYSKLCALSVYSTLEGQIIACHVDYQTVAEQGTGAMFHVAHILKENINELC